MIERHLIIGLPDGGLKIHENAPDELQLPDHDNVEEYSDKQAFEDRLEYIYDKLPDHVTLPDEIGNGR